MNITEIEGNFWKEKLNALHNENLVTSKYLQNSFEFGKSADYLTYFQNQFPSYNVKYSLNESSFEGEFYFDDKFMIRLFIQNHGQMKISFFQKIDGNFEKNSDSKFLGNPFIDITRFAEKFPEYKKELLSYTESSLKSEKKLKLTSEIIKALLKAKFKDTDILWQLEIDGNKFKLLTKDSSGEKISYLTLEGFKDEIKNLQC